MIIISVQSLTVYRKTEELLYKIYPRLVNYPKSEKFSLCQNIKEAFFNILTNISLGNSVKSKRKTYIYLKKDILKVNIKIIPYKNSMVTSSGTDKATKKYPK